MAAPKPSDVNDPTTVFEQITNDGDKESSVDALESFIDVSNAASKENIRVATGEVVKPALPADDAGSLPEEPSIVSLSEALSTEKVGDTAVEAHVPDSVTTSTEQISVNEPPQNELLSSNDTVSIKDTVVEPTSLESVLPVTEHQTEQPDQSSKIENGALSRIPDTASSEKDTVPHAVQDIPLVYEALSSDQTDAIQVTPTDTSRPLPEQSVEEIHSHSVIEEPPKPILQETATAPAESLPSDVENAATVAPSAIGEPVEALVVPEIKPPSITEGSVLPTTSISNPDLEEMAHTPAKEALDSQAVLSHESLSAEPASGTDVVHPIDAQPGAELEAEEIVASPQPHPITNTLPSTEVTPAVSVEDIVVPVEETAPAQVEASVNSEVENVEKLQVDQSRDAPVPSAQQPELLHSDVVPTESQPADLEVEAVATEVQEPIAVSVETSQAVPANDLVYEEAVAPTETAIEQDVELHEGQVIHNDEPPVVGTPAENSVADVDTQATQDHVITVKEDISTGDLSHAPELVEESQESREHVVATEAELVASEPQQTITVQENLDSVEHHEPDMVENDKVDHLVPADTPKSTDVVLETLEAIPLPTADVSVEQEPQTTIAISSIDVEVTSSKEDGVDVSVAAENESHAVEHSRANAPVHEELSGPVQESSIVAQDEDAAVASVTVKEEAPVIEEEVPKEAETFIEKDEPTAVEVPAVDTPANAAISSPEPSFQTTSATVEAALEVSPIAQTVVNVTSPDIDANSMAGVEATPIGNPVTNGILANVDESVGDDSNISDSLEDDVGESAKVDSIPQIETTKAQAETIDTTQLSAHDIERPKSPYPPSFQVTTIGRGVSPTKDESLQDESLEAAAAETEPAQETDFAVHPVIAEVKTDTEATQLEVPKTADESSSTPPRSWTPSYSVHSQGSPLLGPVDLPPSANGGLELVDDACLADDTGISDEHVHEEITFSQNDEIAVLSTNTAAEPDHAMLVEAPSIDISQRVSTPAPPSDRVPETTPDANENEVIQEVSAPPVPEQPIQKVEHLVPEVLEASALVNEADSLNVQEPQPHLNLSSSNLTAPVNPEIERPSSPSSWVPSYSVNTQGSQLSQEHPLEDPLEHPLEDVSQETANAIETAVETLDQSPVENEYQVNEPVIQKDVSSNLPEAHPAQQLLTDSILNEPANAFDHTVEETTVEKTALLDPVVSKSIETPVILADDSRSIHEAITSIEGDKHKVPVLLVDSEVTDANEKDLSLDSENNSQEQPPRPWTPSYSVTTQGPGATSDAEQNETLAPANIAELTGDNSQIADEVNNLVIKNGIEKPRANTASNAQPSEAIPSEPSEANLAHDAPLTSGQCTPTVPSGAQTPTIGDLQENISKQFPTTDTTADFISRLFVVTEDTDQDPSSTASDSQSPSTRKRLESAASSRFFPGAWFSQKAPHDGRTSLEIAQGEFSSSKPTSPVSDSLPASAVDGSRSLTDEEKKRWCVIM